MSHDLRGLEHRRVDGRGRRNNSSERRILNGKSQRSDTRRCHRVGEKGAKLLPWTETKLLALRTRGRARDNPRPPRQRKEVLVKAGKTGARGRLMLFVFAGRCRNRRRRRYPPNLYAQPGNNQTDR